MDDTILKNKLMELKKRIYEIYQTENTILIIDDVFKDLMIKTEKDKFDSERIKILWGEK